MLEPFLRDIILGFCFNRSITAGISHTFSQGKLAKGVRSFQSPTKWIAISRERLLQLNLTRRLTWFFRRVRICCWRSRCQKWVCVIDTHGHRARLGFFFRVSPQHGDPNKAVGKENCREFESDVSKILKISITT